jgi:hypothetical protein
MPVVTRSQKRKNFLNLLKTDLKYFNSIKKYLSQQTLQSLGLKSSESDISKVSESDTSKVLKQSPPTRKCAKNISYKQFFDDENEDEAVIYRYGKKIYI